MTSSAAVVSPPSPKPLTSDIDDDDDEYEIEYEEIEEEIEVEEEVEVEEEIEEEVEIEPELAQSGGNDGIREDLTTPQLETQKTDKIVELDGHKDHIQSSSLTEGVLIKNIGDVKTTKSNEGETSKYNDQKTLLNDSVEVNQAKTTPPAGDINATSITANVSGENVNAVASIVAEANQSALEGVGNKSPRLHAAQIRFRDSLPSADYGRESKKLRIVCEFHAKGWCIKGNSCRFLHIKDGQDAVVKESEALGREASSSACTPLLQTGENPKLNSETEKLVFPQDDTYAGAPTLEDRGYFYNYQYNSTLPVNERLSARSSAYHGSSSIISHENDRDTRVSGFGQRMDETISKKSNITQIDNRLADLFQSSLEHHPYVSSSTRQSNPLASRSKSDTLSHNHNLREVEPAKCEASSSFDWEPSAPFCPSHEITRSILPKESLTVPMHESIDKKGVEDIRAKFSNSDQGSTIKDVNVLSKSPQEEDKLLDVLTGDTVKDNIFSSSNDVKVTHDKTVDETVLEVDGSGTKDDIDADFKRDDHLQSESRAFKYFQSALIDFIKELVKPRWRDGSLTKDAHKLVVKKSVDKVLSTLPTHQIPTTSESVKFYLSSCQPKLAKLVEGYISMYGKMRES